MASKKLDDDHSLRMQEPISSPIIAFLKTPSPFTPSNLLSMWFPDSQLALRKLQEYRDRNNHKISDVYEKYKTITLEAGQPVISSDAFSKRMEGTTGIKWDEITPILKAHGFKCLQLFIDYCQQPDKEDIRAFPPAQFGFNEKNLFGIRALHPDEVAPFGTRIDVLELGPEKQTPFRSHEGHEFLFVQSGNGMIEFANGKDEESVRQEQMGPGHGFAYVSSVWHRFKNLSDSESLIIHVARPSQAEPIVDLPYERD